ncbi:hypothetical protein ASD67_10685 [Sphingopyxis sp. Root1497]|uniref:Shedu immune nuclease family protein n=1 Tax=Sphingopyxis sp. Root1497 TaxID=1736474 RepID=UPI0006FC41BC|nr:Shedu immune nuclease family protein [Sphingopyxis sp. Root1497]KQZ64872.1 hypothetical protein ASD67_10685 [Sphingopyxis sp. Root1497]
MTDNHEFFKLRREGKTYISKVFTYTRNSEPMRNVIIVLEGSDVLHLGEIEGALRLRMSGTKRKTQVTAVVSQDDKSIRRVTLQTFQSRGNEDWYQGYDEHSFTLRQDEYQRLTNFLNEVDFIDLSNPDGFHIEDMSGGARRRAIVDAVDGNLIEQVRSMNSADRAALLGALRNTLTPDEINVLLGRRAALEEFEREMRAGEWPELQWQEFFERQPWVFGYGLHYRVMRPFDREMTVSTGGVDNREKSVIDFLMQFTDYTVLVEIKRPDTPIFKAVRGSESRSGTHVFSDKFTGAISQILEQKAEWLSFAEMGSHYSRDGTKPLMTRTRNAKTILVIGSRDEFAKAPSIRDKRIMQDTFELYRQDLRSIEIITFDELLDRAQFIIRDTSAPE